MLKSFHIAIKDLRTEFRTKQMLNSMIVFSLIVIVIFGISFSDVAGDMEVIEQLAPGILWISFAFVATIGISRSFSDEIKNRCIDGLRMCPVDTGAIYTGKMLSTIMLLFIVEMLVIPLFSVMFNYTIQGVPELVLIIFLGTAGIVCVGLLLSAITINSRSGELLLPVLLFPLIIPVIIPAVISTGKILAGGSISDIIDELRLLGVYVIIFYVISRILFEYTIQE